MFKQVKQVQTINVNEWVDKLMAAKDATNAVEKIRGRLNDTCFEYIRQRQENLATRTSMYDFYYEPELYLNDLERWLMDVIEYKMPDDLVEWWARVCAEYHKIKTEDAKAEAQE